MSQYKIIDLDNWTENFTVPFFKTQCSPIIV